MQKGGWYERAVKKVEAKFEPAEAKPGQTVTFTLTGPNNTSYSEQDPVSNGSASTSTGFTPTVAGTYDWVATYNGDTNNSSVTSGAMASEVGVMPMPISPTF